ncbi:hypothetical protein [Ralstonia sp. A12]|uniref:hypothetical protein n=1 Tax=Ralstonia sp. A12 TaxID=1217052 RepID=UPI000694B365|nr:hypothetical protein [Ralstonia sp. A12]
MASRLYARRFCFSLDFNISMLRYQTTLCGVLICASIMLLPGCSGGPSSTDSGTTSSSAPLSVDHPAGLDTYGSGSKLTFTASSNTTSWSLTGPGALSTTQGASVTYTPPTTVQADVQVTITAALGNTTVSKTITLHAPILRPVAGQVSWYVGDAPIAMSVSPQFTTGTPTWSSGAGTFSATQGNSVTFTPVTVSNDTQAVVSVTAGGHTESVSIALKPASEKTLTLSSPSVQAGNGSVTLTVPSTISHGALKWAASIGTITVNADGSATYTPPATLSTAAVATVSATDGSSAPFTGTISVTPSATLALSPSNASTSASGAPVSLTATIANPNTTLSAANVQWTVRGHGSLSATSGATVSYIPDPAYTTANDAATVTATLGALQQSVNITLNFQSTARFSGPYGIAVDGSGNLFVADTFNSRIRKITVSGVVSTFAGSGSAIEADGTGTTAGFNVPISIATDNSGNVYVLDNGSKTIRKITPAGVVTTLATAGGASSVLNSIAVDSAGNVYVADSGTNTLSKVTPAGAVSTLTGSVNDPLGVAVDGNGTVYVAERTSCTIRKVSPVGVVSTLAGSGGCAHTDGTGSAAAFNVPGFIAVDGNGNLYVAESQGNTIRKVTPAGVVTTLAGSGAAGSADGLGTNAQFTIPVGITVDSNGVVYVTDLYNSLIRMISPTGNVSTLAGAAGVYSYADGTALPRQ